MSMNNKNIAFRLIQQMGLIPFQLDGRTTFNFETSKRLALHLTIELQDTEEDTIDWDAVRKEIRKYQI